MYQIDEYVYGKGVDFFWFIVNFCDVVFWFLFEFDEFDIVWDFFVYIFELCLDVGGVECDDGIWFVLVCLSGEL